MSCDKSIELALPTYESEYAIEMYLEQGRPMRCLIIESLPYTDTAINKPVQNATVLVSDGNRTDTLSYLVNQDKTTGRYYNYYNPRVVPYDTTRIYTLTIIGQNQKITGSTRFSQSKTYVDSLIVKESLNEADSFSVGLIITDSPDTENYYRFLVGTNINAYTSDPTDVRISDMSFNGKAFSLYSEPDFAINDTVTVRIYSLLKEHYQYLESIGNARRSNYNPFSQPSRIKSNLNGGIGIFTAIRYTERTIIIK
jgi:hypothetical protein